MRVRPGHRTVDVPTSASDDSPRGAPARQRTAAGRKFVSRKIRTFRAEGFPQKQAVAASLNVARREGFKIPRARSDRGNPGMGLTVLRESGAID